MMPRPARQALAFAPNLSIVAERTNVWLVKQLTGIWSNYFADVPQVNQVEIEFARRWKGRLAMICLSESGRTSYIGVNRLLRHPLVPEPICLVAIAHELVHYAHGFGSPLPRLYPHPHQGNVVSRELIDRGLGAELQLYTSWTRCQWLAFYEEQARVRHRRPSVSLVR